MDGRRSLRVALPGAPDDPGWTVWVMIALAVGALAGLVAGPIQLYRAISGARARRRRAN